MAKSVEDWDKHLAPAVARLQAEMKKALIRASFIATKEAKLRATTGPKVRSGRLRASIRAFVRRGPELVLQAGSGRVKYARTQEFGATIQAKRSRYLAIPLEAARTGAGVARWPGPRSVPGLFFIRSKAGNPLLVVRDGDGIRPMFALKERVTIKAQPFLRPAMALARKSLRPGLRDAMRTVVLP